MFPNLSQDEKLVLLDPGRENVLYNKLIQLSKTHV